MKSDGVPVFRDILIPGGDGRPSASEALDDAPLDLPAADEVWLRENEATLAQVPAESRLRAVQELERAEPERFGRVLGALYAAYYTSPKAHEVVLRLAKAGRREPSTSFDEALLVQVIATRAGERRF